MSNVFFPAPEPETPLGRMRILSKTSGLRASPLQLGAMSIGDAWTEHMGSMDREKAFALLDAYEKAGGNMIDTANMYQNGQSETWLGDWMAARGNRDKMIIATKFNNDFGSSKFGHGKAPNHQGNHKRSMFMSVRDSLKKLQTEWIDVLYLHLWDHTTSVEELMDGLDVLVKQGKVLYLGISDTPAWVVAAANEYAKANGKTQFSIYQGQWNCLVRDIERDVIPMARHYGMAIAPWDVLGAGRMASRRTHEKRKADGEKVRAYLSKKPYLTDKEWEMVDCLEGIAQELGLGDNVPAVAIAYVMAKAPNVFPIIGGRKVEYLKSNIKALEVRLSQEQVKKIEAVNQFDVGFPHTIIGDDPKANNPPSLAVAMAAVLDFPYTERAVGY